MADYSDGWNEVADDLTDARGLGKLMWLLVAVLRFATAFLVIAGFLGAILTLNSRVQADRALAGDNAASVQALAEMGGGNGISQAANKELMDAARAAQEEIAARQLLEKREAASLKDIEKYATQLQELAVRAGCTAGTIDAALRCNPDPATDPTLSAEFRQLGQLYRAEHQALLDTRAELLQQKPTYAAKLFAPGGDLSGVLPALDAKEEIKQSAPLAGPVIEWFFRLPLLVSSMVVAFLAGMFGAVAVLLVLLAFPSHAPLTFGGGKYFFLRMFTGGFIAVIVFMVIQSGLAFTGLGDVQALAGVSVADPVKIALVGMFAGGFSEQLAGAVNSFVTQRLAAIGGGSGAVADSNPEPALQAGPDEHFGAMGPGASAGH